METILLKPDTLGIVEAVDILKSGGLVAVPTETVYGLAGNALSEKAVAKIFSAKDRPAFDPLIVHVLSKIDALKWISPDHVTPEMTSTFNRLADRFWPGPLTLVMPKASSIPDIVTSGLSTVGIRVPAHPAMRAVLKSFALPLAAPSANQFGRISPVTAMDAMNELAGQIDAILDGGQSAVGLESTILKIENDGGVVLMRSGGTPVEAIEALGFSVRSPEANSGIEAPGQTESHYAPAQVFVRLPQRIDAFFASDENRIGWNAWLNHQRLKNTRIRKLLILSPDRDCRDLVDYEWEITPQFFSLSKNGNAVEAAAKLFSTLRKMDQLADALLVVEPCASEAGLYRAIQDRLNRASRLFPG